MSLPADVLVRPAVEADWRFVSDAWMRSYRDADSAGVVPNHLWPSVMLEMLDGLAARGMRVLVLCSRERPDVLLGFVATEAVKDGTALHYLFVKRDFRRRGLGAGLLAAADLPSRVFTTHRTPSGERLLRRVRISWKWAPEICRRR